MNGLYDMLLFLFILGAATQGINDMGMFEMSVPETGVEGLDDDQVKEIQASSLSAESSTYSTVDILFMFMRVIGMGIVAMFTIIPMIITWGTALGAPLSVVGLCAGILQAPISYVTFFGLWEWWTGRSA